MVLDFDTVGGIITQVPCSRFAAGLPETEGLVLFGRGGVHGETNADGTAPVVQAEQAES